MEISGQDIREYIQKRSEEKQPQNKEEVMQILEEIFHELKMSGKIRSDADLDYWKKYFSQRWRQFLGKE
ncbi:MAG: hypothetical protein LR000_00630 [Candidatus Pacebacteria bacterium]|nr:hypothetical protein [Candidatus Paceibacterota bacterium]